LQGRISDHRTDTASAEQNVPGGGSALVEREHNTMDVTTGAFMPENHRQQTLWIGSCSDKFIGLQSV
jgi:hypothetical protein